VNIAGVFHPDVLLKEVVDVQKVFVFVFEAIELDTEWHSFIIHAHNEASAIAVQKSGNGFEPGDLDAVVEFALFDTPAQSRFEFGSSVLSPADDLFDLIFRREWREQAAAFVLKLDVAADAGTDFCGIEGFADKVHRAQLDAAGAILRILEAREEDNGEVFRGGIAAQLAADCETVCIGHHHVEQDKVWIAFASKSQGIGCFDGANELVAVAVEGGSEDLDTGRFVVDQEDGRFEWFRGHYRVVVSPVLCSATRKKLTWKARHFGGR
jgi:hypothetical protein